ncbi:MAG: FHA domain-containing protein, partial [Verrucomicrobiota bacterium]
MNLKLVLLSQAKCDATEFNLSESSYTIGRKRSNELLIEEFCVSDYHAEIYRTPEGDYEVKDLDSSEGTFLNRKLLSSPAKIKAGDVLKFGIIKVGVHEQKGAEHATVSDHESGDGIIRFDVEPLIEELDHGRHEAEESEPRLSETP